MTKSLPDTAIPPGEHLAEEIEARGISQKELAKRMGRPLNAVNEIINGKKSITAETALQLEEVMPEILARFWLNLETNYQLTKALISKRTRLPISPVRDEKRSPQLQEAVEKANLKYDRALKKLAD